MVLITRFSVLQIFCVILITFAYTTHSNSAPGSPTQKQARALTLFEKSLVIDSPESESLSVSEIMQELKNLEQDYIDELEDRRSSYGLFAVGEYDNDIENSEQRYLAGIEWRIFNDGYYEAVRRDTQKIMQTQLEFYQLRRDMIDRQLEEDLYHLFTIENYINLAYYREKKSSLSHLYNKRIEQLKNGYTTELDVLDIKRQLKSAENSRSFYNNSVINGLSEEQLTMLNNLESVKLKPATHLIELAQSSSFNLKIQDNFIDRSEFFPAWTDDVALNINAGYKHEFYEKDRTILGIEIEVPLMLDSSRQSLIDTQKRIYKYQKQAIQLRIKQRVEKLFSFFGFQQRRLLGQQDNIELLLLKAGKNEKKENYIIQQLGDDPARNLDLITINLIDSRYEALLTRLKIYEIILKLLALTQADSVTSLFVFD